MAMCKSKDCQHGKESPIRAIVCGVNDMATTHPDLAKELVGDATKVSAGTHKKLDWMCVQCGHEWKATGANRKRGRGCPKCALVKRGKSRGVSPREKSLAVLFPDIAKEIDEDCDPFSIYPMSAMKLFWRCQICSNRYRSAVHNRTRLGSGCPKCGMKKGCANAAIKKKKSPYKKSLAFNSPELAMEYRGDVLPHEVYFKSRAIVCWECCECFTKWKTAVYNRSNGKGCPSCSKGGHDQTKESFVYLIYRPGQIQYGIMNIWTDRLKTHARKGWELLDKIEVTGQKARSLETKIKQTLRAKGIPTGSNAFREKFDGSTEAFQEVDLCVRTIRELTVKLGLDLEAFLAA